MTAIARRWAAPITVCPDRDDDGVGAVRARVPDLHRISGRADLEALLGSLLAMVARGTRPGATVPAAPRFCDAQLATLHRSLDLVGPATYTHGLLELGDWTIDASNPTVAAFFRELHDQDVLPRLGITSLRLLGSSTGVTAAARWTICALSDLLGLEVFGTGGEIGAPSFDVAGFIDNDGDEGERTSVLISSEQLRVGPVAASAVTQGAPALHRLDLDQLRAEPEWRGSTAARARRPRYRVPAERVREVLDCFERDGGRVLPGLLASPRCELWLPGASADQSHRIDVLQRAQIIRVFPRADGVAGADGEHGVLFGVNDASALAAIVESLAR